MFCAVLNMVGEGRGKMVAERQARLRLCKVLLKRKVNVIRSAGTDRRICLQNRLDHGRHKLRFPVSLPFNYYVSLFSNNPNSAFRGCISESHSLEGTT